MNIETVFTLDEIRAILERKGDLHKATAARVFGVAEEAVTPEQRQWAKQANFRSLYDPGFWARLEVKPTLDTSIAEAWRRGGA